MQIWNVLDEKLEKFEFLGLQRSKAITFTSENIEQCQIRLTYLKLLKWLVIQAVYKNSVCWPSNYIGLPCCLTNACGFQACLTVNNGSPCVSGIFPLGIWFGRFDQWCAIVESGPKKKNAWHKPACH